MRYATVLLVVLIAMAAPALALEPITYLVPVVAFNLPGHGENLWSSELYALNTGEEPGRIEVIELLPGAIEPLQTFAPCFEPAWTLSPGTPTVLSPGLRLCASSFVGALLLRVDGTIQLRSRMLNHRQVLSPDQKPGMPIQGLGQDIPVFPVPQQPSDGTVVSLWPLIWHRNTCTLAPAFESYLGIANYGDEWGWVRVGEADDPAGVIVDGNEVPFGDRIDVPPRSWRQYRLQPHDSPFSDCREPETVSVSVEVNGPLVVYGSVVDRLSQDPRTVPAIAPPSGARPQME